MIWKRRDTTPPPATSRPVERDEADWTTHYTLEGLRDHGWRHCRILEVSRDGIELELPGATLSQLTAYRVIVALDVPRASLRLRGDVRSLERAANGGVCIGLAFGALSAFERHMFDTFLETSPVANAAG